MAWTYWTWIEVSSGISAAIVVFTAFVLFMLFLENDTIYYGIVARLLDIQRCFIDVHHNIIQKDERFDDSPDLIESIKNIIPQVGEPRQLFQEIFETSLTRNVNVDTNVHQDTRNATSKDSRSHPEHERQVFNMYGKYISAHRKRTRLFIFTLTTIIISAALIAAFNSLILTASSVYRGGPCPPHGPMECFCGNNYTYFSCNTGANAQFPVDAHVGACFRWTARDITTSDVTTQLGITAGLLIALGGISQALLRIYLFAFNKRLGVAVGIHRIASKTIGVNRHTARTKCCCCNLCCHCSIKSLRLFRHPSAVIITSLIYLSIPVLIGPGVVLMYYYELSVTALTFIVLITVALICLLAIAWIMLQENEANANIPGGWQNLQNSIKKLALIATHNGIGDTLS